MERDQKVTALCDEYFDFFTETYPELATAIGIHTHDARLSSYSRSTIDARLRKLRQFEKRAEECLSEGGLSVSASIDARLVASNSAIQVLEIEKLMKPYADPTMYMDISLYGLFLLASRDVLPIETRARYFASRLKEFRRVLSEARENLENPPAVFTSTALGMLKGAAEFVDETVEYFAAKVPDAGTELESGSSMCKKAIREFEVYVQNELLPRSSGDFAVGRDVFDTKLKVEHMLDIDTRALEKMGRELLETTKGEIEQLSARLYPNERWKDVIERLKEYHPDSSGLRKAYEEHMAKAKSFVQERRLVSIPPGEELRILDTPVFYRSIIPYAAYLNPGPFDTKQEGLFFVTPVDTSAPEDVQSDQLRGHSYPGMVLCALHEAYPGHHLQLVHSNRVKSRLRHTCDSTVFAEGWALYCEQLMKEEGFYDSGDIELFQLKDVLWRASRVVVDVGLHTRAMIFDEAVEFLVTHALIERANAVAEVRRYTHTPSQPSSYAIGKELVLGLRDEEKRRLGARFDLFSFHERLLSFGTIPFKLVEEEFKAG
ncbi:MAG: DUF885 domain-containing protein [Candidatus Eiseniibacteriota bacterium]|nr:MAG: DUF885 domain-containing protein [Candidatus Eisenbacteria bacterium]